MFYEGSWVSLGVELERVVRWNSKKEERVEILVLPTSVVSFLVKSNSRL
jgi:hypothetical protein